MTLNLIGSTLSSFVVGCILATSTFAQCAGCGADFNRADRAAVAREVERQRLERVDSPIYPDPLGNALISGGVTGIATGSASAAARGVVTGTAIGAAMTKVKEGMHHK
jgi:hypothetical protein